MTNYKYEYDRDILERVTNFPLLSSTKSELLSFLEGFKRTRNLNTIMEFIKTPNTIIKEKEFYLTRGTISIFITFFDFKTGKIEFRSARLLSPQ